MSEKATLVVTAVPNPKEQEAMQKYLKGVMPLLMGAGGELVKRLKVQETIKGDPSGMVLVMNFESAEKIRGVFKSDEYAALVPARDKAFPGMNILVAGDM